MAIEWLPYECITKFTYKYIKLVKFALISIFVKLDLYLDDGGWHIQLLQVNFSLRGILCVAVNIIIRNSFQQPHTDVHNFSNLSKDCWEMLFHLILGNGMKVRWLTMVTIFLIFDRYSYCSIWSQSCIIILVSI